MTALQIIGGIKVIPSGTAATGGEKFFQLLLLLDTAPADCQYDQTADPEFLMESFFQAAESRCKIPESGSDKQ